MSEFYGIQSHVPANPIGLNAKVQLRLPKELPLEAADGSRLAEDVQLTFYQEAVPLYASVDYLQIKAQGLIDSMPEAALYMMSYAASTQIDAMVQFDPVKKFPDRTVQRYFFWLRAKTEWAAAMAVIEIFRGLVAHRGTSAMRKTLADFSLDLGPMANIISSARGMIRDLTDQANVWRSAVFSGGAPDYEHPFPLAAVKGGWNPNDNAAGIGRGWNAGFSTLNERTPLHRSGNSVSRPERTGRYYVCLPYIESYYYYASKG
jgi:hypothetical protein